MLFLTILRLRGAQRVRRWHGTVPSESTNRNSSTNLAKLWILKTNTARFCLYIIQNTAVFSEQVYNKKYWFIISKIKRERIA